MTLLTVEEFREFVQTDLGDASLQVLLDAAEYAIDAALTELDYLGQRTQIRNGGSTIIFLRERTTPDGITSITETVGNTVTTLDADDWLLRSDGASIERLNNGTNPPIWWWAGVAGAWSGRVTVTYTPADDLANRERVQVGLVKLDLDQRGAASSFRIGNYSEAGASTASQTYEQSRQALLNSLIANTWEFA